MLLSLKVFFKQVVILISVVVLAFAKPNFVFVVTDDQDLTLNGLEPMQHVREFIANEGITFQNAFITSPMCCPSRSSFLTGKYLHNVGVRNNSISGNCSSPTWQSRYEPFSIAALLKQFGGYNTFYAGKYLNQYGHKDTGGTRHIPAGYDWWIGLVGNSVYYNYTLSVNGTARHYADEYLTDVLRNFSKSFLTQEIIKDAPFFMMVSTPAPHAPFTPAPRHENEFLNVTLLRTPSFNYSANDKHWLITMPPKHLPEDVSILEKFYKMRWQTLLAVDELVLDIVQTLQEKEILNNTYIIYMSDNGFHLGQFTQAWDKRQPYETDVRVPLLMRGPKITPKSVTSLPVSSIDIAPTLLHLANITIPDDMDGRSFFEAILQETLDDTERNILVEYFGEGDKQKIDATCPWVGDDTLTQCVPDNWCKCQDSRNNTYACVRRLSQTTDFKFCQFYDDVEFVEAYDLKTDPYELINIYKNMVPADVNNYTATLTNLINCSGKTCHI